MPTNPNALTLEDMQLERSQQAFFGQYGGFTPADTAGRPLRAAVSLAQGMNTESVAKDAAAAKELSLPVETVRSNPLETREELNTRRIMQDQGMADFASRSPEHAALIVDDPDAWEKVWRQVRAMPEAIGQAWDIGKHNQQFAALGREFMDAPEGKLEEVRTRMAAHRKERQAFIPVDSYADEIALTSAVEQLPRMGEMLPKQAGAAALAGLGGAVAGSVVPVLGTTSAAVASARAGWLAATAYTAFEAERDSAVADFALLQDEEGQHMSREDVVGAATIYAAGAAAIETAGEAFFLSLAKPFLGGLASKIAPKAFLKTAVQRAMQNKSTRAAVLDIAKRVGQNALGEGGEESLQGLLQDVMQVMAMAKSDEHGNTSFGEQTVFKTETVKNLVQNFGAGFGAGLWLGGVPMITLGAQDVVAAHRAGLWADEQKALHAQVEATKVKAASPELTKAMLEEGPKLEGNAVIPADALMELHQQDTLILPSLGMEEKAVQQAADMGQELTVPLARLHASLDQNQANAVLDIAREEPQALNAAEARRLTDRLRTMGERAIAETAGRTEELRARDMEVERLREEMTRAVDSVPGLRARLESGEGLQGEAGGVAQFVEDNLRVAVGMARYLADETGRPLAEFLRPITYEGLDVNSRGQLVPMYKIREEMESEEDRARAEADRPFWELVWGRVDPESLKTDYAETYKELRKSKRGLFMPAGRGGVPLDQIADELNERGIFTGSADDLLELLKTKERPRRGYYQEGELTEQEEKAEAAQRVQAWLSEENLAQAKDLDRGAIFEIFGNELEAVAVLPEHLLALFSDEVLDTRVYSGMGYFIDHAVNNHPEVAPSLYAESIQSTLDNYTDVYLDESTDSATGKKRNSLVFMQDVGGGKKNVVTLAEDDAGRIILYKNFYQSKRNPSKKLRRVEPPVGGPTTISHAETSARQRPLSALGDNASIAQGGEDVNSLQQTGWHGAGVDFDAFDFSYMGTGEGHQVHGWGGYVAASKEISDRRYRERFAKGVKILANGERIDEDMQKLLGAIISGSVLFEAMESGDFTKFREAVRWYIKHYRQPDRYRTELIKMLQEQIDRIDANPKLSIKAFLEGVPSSDTYRFKSIVDTARSLAKQEGRRAGIADVRDRVLAHMEPFVREVRQDLETADKLEALDIDNLEVHQNKGQLFELEIPEEEEMLIEGKAFSEQLPTIQEAILRAFGIGEGKTLDALVQEIDHQLSEILDKERAATNTWETAHLAARYDELRRVQYNIETIYELIGKDIYKTLALYLGSPKAASLALLREGVQGISYKGGIDGQAWVIFDEKKMQVVNKLFQFIGEEGAARLDEAEEASTRMDNLDVARQMEEAGKDAAAIKMATGWERGADGKWRYEIDDSYTSLNILYPDMQGLFARSLLSDQQEADLAEKLEIARRVQANPDATMADLFGEDAPRVQRMLFDLGNLDQFIRQTAALLEGDELTLGAILDHEELFTAYPQLRDVRVNIIDDGQSAHGSYSRAANQITLNKAALDDVPLLMHEVQHVLQDEEGFSRGGSPEAFKVNEEGLVDIGRQQMENRLAEAHAIWDAAPPELQEKMRALNRAQINKDFDLMDELEAALSEEEYKVWSEYDWLMGEARTLKAEGNQVTPREAYRSLRGEQEAYNTQRRMGMSYEERLASLASSTEDVARKDQIFLQNALGSAMAMAEGRTKGVIRGETVFTPKGFSRYTPNTLGMDYVVRLFKHANLSTLVHETSHVFFLQMDRLVYDGLASPRMQADYAALCRWVGSKDGFLNRDQHEKLARGMELFLREGKAPAKQLEGAFGRFRRWLTEVYKAITGPYFQDEQGRQITLNPEVRDVFSRILATQEEVARQAADEVIGRDFTAELDKLGVTGAQRVAITGLVKEAKDMAETRLHEAREAGRKAMQAKWKKEAEAQVAEERIYKARKAMRNSGMNMLALASAVGNEAALEFFRKLPGIKREGANPWAFAASFGYDSVDQMVQEMLTTPSKAERVEQLVAQKQAEHDKQFKAQSLIASDQAAAMEEMVQEHIIKAMGGKERGVALAQIKQAAREYLAGLSMDDAINSGKFRYQAVRLMHLEREAIMAQDYGRAMDINFKLRLNMELTRQSQELRDKTHGIARQAAKFCASKIHTPVCRYAVAFLGMKVGLMPGTKMIARTAQDKDLSMVKAWAVEATDYGYTFEMDEELWYADINPWRHMSLSYFDRVYRQLTQIMTIEQNMRKMDTWQGQQELASVSADLHLHIFGNDPTRQKVGVESDSPKVRRLKKFFNQMLTVATRLKLWDDDKPMGKAWNLIMRPMQEARADELRRFEKASKQIRQIINETYSHAELMAMKDKAFDQALGESVSKEERLLVLLNLGNAGNRNRLKEGFRQVKNRNKWSDWEIDAMVAPLEKKDYDFAQKIWDHFEQYKKERFDQEESLTGIRPLEVEATPLQTKYGTYRGGYFPIKYDTERGARAASLDKVNKAAVSMLPSVAHGAMKDRQDKGLGTPLKLRFSVITDAVAESVHDLAFRRPVIEVSKLLRQHPVQEAMEGTQGALVYKQMWDWLNDIAGERPAQNSLDNVASWSRSRLAIFAMGYKVTTMLAQATGLLATTTQLGWKYTLRGVQDTFKHGIPRRAQAAWVDTQARSVMMKNRLQSFDRDVLALTKDLTEAGSSNRFLDRPFRAFDLVKKHAFTLTGWVQLWAADLPTWRGAFLKGLEELGMDEKEAALYADTMVETAQGSGATKDLSEIMRSDGMTQLLTVFYSYFNALYNMFYRSAAMAGRHKDLPHVMHTASMALVLWFVEPAITALLTNRGPEDDEEWWEWWLKEGVQQPFQMIVGVRDISNMIWNSIEGKFGQGYRFSPAADIIEAFGKTAIDLGRVVENVGEGDYEGSKKAAKSLSRDIGMISGTPLLGAQMQTTLGNMWDWLDGSEEFNLQDLFFTRKK